MDTASDFRILVAEDALGRLEGVVRNRRLSLPVNWGRAQDVLRGIRSRLLRVKYMYLPARQLAALPELREIREMSVELARLLLDKEALRKFRPDPVVVAETRYALRILYGLRNRLLFGDDNNPLYAIDIEGVLVVSVRKHPGADKLYVTKAEGALPYDIVTNISDIKKGEIRAAAILPPAVIMGVLSEAMYCSGPIPGEYKARRPPEDLIYRDEVVSKIYMIVERLKR